ncbi:MAG: phospholipase D-like domain-containing protein [Candidatus Sericytochromatia bacterium]|nr:phospholipase D-like domain-containing protein [Candidatus Sericytochromatia bacterium]
MIRLSSRFLLLAAALSVTACGALAPSVRTTSATVEAAARARDTRLLVWPEAGVAPILEAIASARRTLDVQVYILSNDDIIKALAAAADRGVRVRVMLDPAPYNPSNPNSPLPINKETLKKLTGSKVMLAWTDPSFRFTHSKFMIVDRAKAWILTANMSKSGMTRNREFGVVDTRPEDVRDMNALFDADWAHKPWAPTSPRLVVSPVNAEARLQDLISSARQAIEVYDEVMYDEATFAALGERAKAGVKVRVLMGDPEHIPGNASAAARLKEMGIESRWIAEPVIHAKMVSADNRFYVGSVNLTTNSIKNNREVGLILDEADLLGSVRGTFEKDWAASTAFAPVPPTTAWTWMPPGVSWISD